MIGKRKREVAVAPKRTKPTQEKRASSTADDDDKQAIFRKYFEAQFKPLDEKLIQPIRPTMPESEEEDDLDEDESEWEGLDEEDDTPRVEVIEHTDTGRRNSIDELFNKKDLKAFMSSKPPVAPTTTSVPKSLSKSASTPDEAEEDDDKLNLKNDIALQRLLKESHLLDTSSPTLSATGVNRHKTTDLRLQSLGSKTSIFTQEKMPMSHRKGINAKKEMLEDKRRREARENGIILEKPSLKKKAPQGRRERGVGAPSVGKFAGGTLRLSKKDLDDIQGPKPRGGKGKKGRR